MKGTHLINMKENAKQAAMDHLSPRMEMGGGGGQRLGERNLKENRTLFFN